MSVSLAVSRGGDLLAKAINHRYRPSAHRFLGSVDDCLTFFSERFRKTLDSATLSVPFSCGEHTRRWVPSIGARLVQQLD
jgi:hypothetical protein